MISKNSSSTFSFSALLMEDPSESIDKHEVPDRKCPSSMGASLFNGERASAVGASSCNRERSSAMGASLFNTERSSAMGASLFNPERPSAMGASIMNRRSYHSEADPLIYLCQCGCKVMNEDNKGKSRISNLFSKKPENVMRCAICTAEVKPRFLSTLDEVQQFMMLQDKPLMPKGRISAVHGGPADMGASPNFPLSGASKPRSVVSMSSANQRCFVNQGASSSIHHETGASFSEHRAKIMNAMPKRPISLSKDTVKNRTMMRSQSKRFESSKSIKSTPDFEASLAELFGHSI